MHGSGQAVEGDDRFQVAVVSFPICQQTGNLIFIDIMVGVRRHLDLCRMAYDADRVSRLAYGSKNTADANRPEQPIDAFVLQYKRAVIKIVFMREGIIEHIDKVV